MFFWPWMDRSWRTLVISSSLTFRSTLQAISMFWFLLRHPGADFSATSTAGASWARAGRRAARRRRFPVDAGGVHLRMLNTLAGAGSCDVRV